MRIVFDAVSRDDRNTQEKLQANRLQNLGGGGGGKLAELRALESNEFF